MPKTLMGKSTFGDNIGFCQAPSKMGDSFDEKFQKIKSFITTRVDGKSIIITSMTGLKECEACQNTYIPKIRMYSPKLDDMFDPVAINENCMNGLDSLRPGADFIVWDSKSDNVVGLTFSREAPIITFEDEEGKKCIGTILRPSLMVYGDYLFSTIKDNFGSNIRVDLVTCNHFAYTDSDEKDISIPTVVRRLSERYGMSCSISLDSEHCSECYHRGEIGNHVVALW